MLFSDHKLHGRAHRWTRLIWNRLSGLCFDYIHLLVERLVGKTQVVCVFDTLYAGEVFRDGGNCCNQESVAGQEIQEPRAADDASS